MQFVEIELDPQEAVVAEAGGMMYMEDGVEMETIFGDGSQQNSGFMGALLGAGKRLLTGLAGGSSTQLDVCKNASDEWAAIAQLLTKVTIV